MCAPPYRGATERWTGSSSEDYLITQHYVTAIPPLTRENIPTKRKQDILQNVWNLKPVAHLPEKCKEMHVEF